MADALTAPDALCVGGVFRRVHAHAAHLLACPAVGALVPVHVQLHHGYFVKGRVKGSQRAQVLTERTVNHHARRDQDEEQAELPRKQLSKDRKQLRVRKGQQDSRQRARRAYVLAEYRRQLERHRQDHYQEKENDVLQLPQRSIPPEGLHLYRKGNFVKQVLQKAKRADQSADKPPQECSEKDQQPQHVVRKPKLIAGDGILQGSDGAGSRRPRAGIAVQAGDTDVLRRAPVNLPRKETF